MGPARLWAALGLSLPLPAGPAEFPQLAGRPVIVVDRLVDGVGLDFASAVALDRGRNYSMSSAQSRLVVGGYAFPRGPALDLRPYSRTKPPASRRLMLL